MRYTNEKSHYLLTQLPVLCQSALNYRVCINIAYWKHQHKDIHVPTTWIRLIQRTEFQLKPHNSNKKGNCQHTQHKVKEKELSQCIESFQPSAKHKQMERFSPMHSFSVSIRCIYLAHLIHAPNPKEVQAQKHSSKSYKTNKTAQR